MAPQLRVLRTLRQVASKNLHQPSARKLASPRRRPKKKNYEKAKKENALVKVKTRKIRTTGLCIEHRFAYREGVFLRTGEYEKIEDE